MDRFEWSSLSQLVQGEEVLTTQPSVRLYDGENKVIERVLCNMIMLQALK